MILTEKKYPVISIIVPAKNENTGLNQLYNAIVSAMECCDVSWEIILVDDGSTDSTVDVWRNLMANDVRLGLVRLLKNYGKEAAILAGMRHAKGAAIIPIDADLQDPPECIPTFIREWRSGHDMVYGIRKNRSDPAWKRVTSWAFYRLVAKISQVEIPIDSGDFRLLDRKVVDRLLDLPEVDRFTRGLYHIVSGNSKGVEYIRPERRCGQRSYLFSQSVNQALSSISFTDFPLRLITLFGFFVACLGVSYFCFHLLRYFLGIPMVWGWTSTIAVIIALGGTQLAATGVIGLYLGRVFREVKRRPIYLVDYIEGAASK